jgi:glyoxylase-like metal-dependent hydrolase (beta-lactamase superfamily II)
VEEDMAEAGASSKSEAGKQGFEAEINLSQPVPMKSRREFLRGTAAVAGGFLFAGVLPETLARAAGLLCPPQSSAPQVDPLAAFRAQMGALPIQSQPLAADITMLSGPGGNVVVLNGPDGKVIVDTFVAPAWPKLKETLDGLGSASPKFVIDTHWHFDHTDNNASLRASGFTILAHENTKKRMSEPHDLPVLGLKFPASPAEALPQRTFHETHALHANGQHLALAHVPPAHTDTDIYIHFQEANVLHAGDLFFNGIYPFIDASTGGNIHGMITAAGKLIALANSETKIVPGHGPLGNRSDLEKFCDLLSTARDRVQKLKSAGKSADEVAAAHPFSDLDAAWGKGLFQGDLFARIVYSAL